ncbi:hypothetical protein FJY69_03290 [candidate division WOR-3 bacterium]|nr:hypothetical protein [candidate division WOR-3 bacterium]
MITGHSLWDLLAVFGGCALLMLTSGLVVAGVLSRISGRPLSEVVKKSERDTGFVVGKCENVLILVFMLLGAYTALGLVFAAKAIVRVDEARREPLFYLAGTMVNVTYSILLGLALKVLLRIIP